MPRITLTLEPELLDLIQRNKPKRQALSAFCADLIEHQALALDSASKLPAYRVGAGTQDHTGIPTPASEPELGRSGSDASASPQTAVEAVQPQVDQALEPKKKGGAGGKKDPYAVKAISPDLVPDDLLDCQQLLPEFWAAKKGTRSQGVWTRVCNKLRAWTPEQRREALERAIASGWGDVFEPPSVKAATASGGYVDSITRDQIEREKFLAMFSAQEAA